MSLLASNRALAPRVGDVVGVVMSWRGADGWRGGMFVELYVAAEHPGGWLLGELVCDIPSAGVRVGDVIGFQRHHVHSRVSGAEAMRSRRFIRTPRGTWERAT